MMESLRKQFAGLSLGRALDGADAAPDLFSVVGSQQTQAPPSARVEQKVTRQQIASRLREIHRCEQFGWPLPPGMDERACYDAAFELEETVGVGGVVLSDENRRAMDEAANG